jgi:outer membrane protein assembly factor BamB
MYKRLLVFAFSSALLTTANGENWPTWHGPRANAVSAERDLPLTWSRMENVKWKVPLPAPGNSTPVVWNEHVFLTQALDEGHRRALMAFDRASGRLLWQRDVPCDVTETTHRQNPPCASSPVTDGQAVYAWLGSAGVVACDFAGQKLWHAELGPVLHKWGNGGSPVLYGDLVIVFHGPGEPAFLTALNKKDGRVVWKVEETAINSPVFGSWSTPVVLSVAEHDELILPLPGERIGGEGFLKAYDPATGKELWRCRGLGNEIYAMPVVSEAGDIVVAICGHNGPLLAVRPGGRGDVTDTHRLWHATAKMPQRIGTGIIHQGRLYLAAAPGVVECLDATTGKELWKERVGGNLWGSMLLAGERLYVSNLEGETFVLSAGPEFKLLATNGIEEPTYAALAASNGELFVRSYNHLYCIAKPR